MKLRQRLLVASFGQIAAFAALFLACGIFLRVGIAPLLVDHLAGKTLGTVRSLASELDVPLATTDASALQRVVRVAEHDSDFRGVTVTDAKGALVYRGGHAPDLLALRARGEAAHVIDGADEFAAWAPVVFEGMSLGAVGVAFGKDRLQALGAWSAFLAAIAGLTVVAALAFAVRFSRNFVAPIASMMEFSRRVAEGAFDQKLECQAEGELAELVSHLGAMTDALRGRDAALARQRADLMSSLEQLRRTQEELVRSTRLASVGEMAGQTAHEVLNPMTSMHGRITRALDLDERVARSNRETLRAIVAAWADAYTRGGIEALAAELVRPVAAGAPVRRLAIEDDLEALRGLATFLDRRAEEERRDLQFLLGEIGRVTRIVDGMRRLNRQRSSPALLGVQEVTSDVVEIMRDAASKRRVTLKLEGDDAEVYVDRTELIQVLTNLVRNAMQAVEEKAHRLGGEVSIVVARRGDIVQIRVRDNGAGIAPAKQDLVFESGFTTRGDTDGTGMGLAIARRLARGFGGSLALEDSRPGVGTTFLLEIPVAARPAAAPARDAGAREGLGA